MTNAAYLIRSYLDQRDWRVRENSNMRFSAQGLNIHLSGSSIANYWLSELLPPECAEAHIDAALHIHDLYALTAYCSGWSLLDLLKQGFGGVQGKIESAPPKHLTSALGQLVNFFYTIQGETAGAIAVSNWDTLLAPFIAYDKMTYQQVKQAVQEFAFNMNVPTRVGFQTPFSNVTLDIEPPDSLASLPVIISGEEQAATYGEFAREMRMLNTAFAEVMLAGDAKGRPFTFPIPTYNFKKDADIDTLPMAVWDMAGKLGIPYFGNYVNSVLDPEDFYSMCCRLRLPLQPLRRREGGFFASAPLTGSVAIISLSLGQIAYLARDEQDFFKRLTKLVLIAADGLDARRVVVEDFIEMGLYPYSKHYLQPVKDSTGKYWGNHFSTVGIIGMHEACLNLFGLGIDTVTGKQFALRTMNFLLARIGELNDRQNGLYNLESTPAESAAYRLAKTDRRNYPDIITAGTKDVPYYTNSTHPPVGHDMSVWQLLDHQDDLQVLYTGGTVTHLFFQKPLPGAQVKQLVRDVIHKYKTPYFTVTPTFAICPEHGSTGGAHSSCLVCDRDTEIWSRIVGYLRPTSEWNVGKQQEFSERSVYG